MTENQPRSLFDRELVGPALIGSLNKLDPRVQVRNPVMFVVEIGAVITTVAWLIQVFGGTPLGGGNEPAWFTFSVAIWLWLTVVFANVRRGAGRGPRQGAGGDACGRCAPRPIAKLRDGDDEAVLGARPRRRRRRRGRRG